MPLNFTDNIRLIYGNSGSEWLDKLPSTIDHLSKIWGLRDLVECPGLSYNMVLSGWQNERAVILKIGLDLNAIERECQALTAFKGHSLIQLYNFDLAQGAILLQRAIPGNTLSDLFWQDDNSAVKIACALAKEMHKVKISKHHKFPLLSDWFDIIDNDWQIPNKTLTLARKLKKELFSKSKSLVLLHGDLHYANILSHQNKWLVIDPKGVIGDPLYDMSGCLLREPFTEIMSLANTWQRVEDRIHISASCNKVDPSLILHWTFIQTVLSICWSLEDKHDVTEKLRFLQMFEGQV